MKRLLLALALVVSAQGVSYAQTTAGQSVIGYYATAPQTGCTVGPCFVPYGSTLPVGGASSTITTLPTNGTDTPSAVTVGTSSAQALAASTAVRYLFIQNVSTTANIACNFGGTAALNTAGSFMLTPNMSRTFEGSFVPKTALNCIASAASTPLTIETN